MRKVYESLLGLLLTCNLLLLSDSAYAQKNSKNENIGACIAAIQISLHKYKYPPSQIGKISSDMFLKYSERVGDMAEKVYAQCKQVESSCVRSVIKNNDDYEIMNEYFKVFRAAINGLDKDRLLLYGQSNCGLINERK